MFPYDPSKNKWSFVILDRLKHATASRPALPEVARYNIPDVGSNSGDDPCSRLARELSNTRMHPASHWPQGAAHEVPQRPPNESLASMVNSTSTFRGSSRPILGPEPNGTRATASYDVSSAPLDLAPVLPQERSDSEWEPPRRDPVVVAHEIYGTPSPADRYGQRPRAITHPCRSLLQYAWRRRKTQEADEKRARELEQEQARKREQARREREVRVYEETRTVMATNRYHDAWQQQGMRWAREVLREGGARRLRRARGANTLREARESLRRSFRPRGCGRKRKRGIEGGQVERQATDERQRSVEEVWRDSEAELERGVMQDFRGRSGTRQTGPIQPPTLQLSAREPPRQPQTMQPTMQPTMQLPAMQPTMQPQMMRAPTTQPRMTPAWTLHPWDGQLGSGQSAEEEWREREAEDERGVMEDYRRKGAQ